MSNLAIGSQPTLQSPGHRKNFLKNFNSGIATQGLLSNTVNTDSGMNLHYPEPQQQQALNGSSNQRNNAGNLQPANQMLDMSNVVAMPTMTQNLGQSNGQQGQNAWLQHMILNPIGPLGGNDTGVMNQANGFSQQQLSQNNFQGNSNAPIFQQQPQQFSIQEGGARSRSQSITSPFLKQQPKLNQPTVPSQAQQQQQSLSMNLQLSAALQPAPLQQQQSNTSHLSSIPNTLTSQTAAQQQQQQQLLLLALMLQQQNNNANNVDNTALSNAMASAEGLKLINSLLTGQLQGNQVQQQQQQQQHHQSNQIFQGQSTVAAQQQDALSSQQQYQQQFQVPNRAQPMQLQSLAMLNQPSLNPNSGNSSIPNGSMTFPSASDAISNLKMSADSKLLLEASKLSKNGGINLPVQSVKSDDSTKSTKTPTVNSRFPRLLYCDSDDAILGEYQTLLRQQLELFEADSHDVINGTFRQGRTTPIRLGQIGLRCKHCAKAPLSARTKGSVYFSQTIKGMYQIGQNMSKVHLCERCPRIPPDIKKRMVKLRSRRHRASGGRAYWIRHLRETGIYEDGTVLRAYPPGVKEKPRTTTLKPAVPEN